MRIGQDPPVPTPSAGAGTVVAVVAAPPGLSLGSHPSLAGIVVSRGEGQVQIETEQGIFVLRGTVAIHPGMRVTLIPDQAGLVRLQRSADAPTGRSATAAPAAPRLLEASDSSGVRSRLENIIAQPLPIRILAADTGARTSSIARPGLSPGLQGEAAIRILAVGDPSDSADPFAPQSPMPPARRFQAIVAARLTEGIVLRAHDGFSLLLPGMFDLREGTPILFAFEPVPAAMQAPPETPFEVIASLLKLLGSGGCAPTAGSSVVRLLPRPDKAFPALAAAFLAASKVGEARAWLGTEADSRLAHDLPELHDRLCAAWRNGCGGEAEANKAWETWTIPLLTASGLSPLRIYRRQGDHEHEDGGDGEATAAVRVVFDCSVTRLGRVQVDTLSRRPRRCDVLIRTEAPLQPPIRDAVSHAYGEAAGLIGLVGALAFRAAADAFVEPDTMASAAGPISLSV